MALIYTNACIYSPVVACLWVLHVHLKLNERLDYSVQADRVRGSVSESEAVLQTYSHCLCHLLVTVDTQSLSHLDTQLFFEKLLGTVSSAL